MFKKSTLNAIKKDALARFPLESCGLIIEGKYVPLDNVHKQPEKAFDCTAQATPLIAAGGVDALVHSHPSTPANPITPKPSGRDMAVQMSTGLVSGIVWTDGAIAADPWFWGPGVAIPPLEGREFRHGPSGTDGNGDCYALIKDFYKLEYNIDLPEFARQDEWWKNNENQYIDNFEKAGFKTISPQDIRRGDVFLTKIGSPVVNHGGIFLGDGKILHHLSGRLSRVESALNYIRRSIWIRYVQNNPDD